jgi:hypothetical protein
MKKLSLLFILCMVSMLAFAQTPAVTVTPGGGDSLGDGPTQELPQLTLGPLSSVGNDVELGAAHTLYATFAKYNNTPTFAGGGTQPLDDATTVTCPVGGGSCLIEFDQYVQIGSSATNNRWAICSKLDGVFVSTPNCPYQGYTNFGGNYFYKVGSFVQFAGSVSPGTHTVRTFIDSDDGLTVGIWSLTYRVYQP